MQNKDRYVYLRIKPSNIVLKLHRFYEDKNRIYYSICYPSCETLNSIGLDGRVVSYDTKTGIWAIFFWSSSDKLEENIHRILRFMPVEKGTWKLSRQFRIVPRFNVEAKTLTLYIEGYHIVLRLPKDKIDVEGDVK